MGTNSRGIDKHLCQWPTSTLIDQMPTTTLLNADKGYDSDAIRRQVKQRGALTDGMCRPVAFLLTGGNVADCKAGEAHWPRLGICRSRCPLLAQRWKRL